MAWTIFFLLLTVQTNAESKITVASVQYPMEGSRSKTSFFKKVESYISKSAEEKADLVLLPEWITLDVWPLAQKKTDAEVLAIISSQITNDYFDHLKKLSEKYNIVIVGGTTAKAIGKKTYNVAPIVFPDGRIVEQRKVYLTKWERENRLGTGDKIEVIDTKWGRIAVLICYDVEFPDISSELAKKEVDLFLVPSMTESPEGERRVRWTAQARAVEHTSFVVIAPTIGEPTPSWKHFGKAVFISPQLPGFPGIIDEGKSKKPGIWTETLDLDSLKKAKRESSWRPAHQIRRR